MATLYYRVRQEIAWVNDRFNECLKDGTWSHDENYPSFNDVRLHDLSEKARLRHDGLLRDVLSKRCKDDFKSHFERINIPLIYGVGS